MTTKDDKVIAKISSAEKAQLVEISTRLDVPISQLVREGVRDQLAKHLKPVRKIKAKKV